MIKGTISSLDITNNQFILSAEIDGETKSITVRYSDETRFFRDGEISSEDAFKNGEEVTIGGRMQEDFFEAFMIAYGELPERGKKR
jgi:DNA/RNA endonuclease YhcR with UshA esterase domain